MKPKYSLRTCIGCGLIREKKELVRLLTNEQNEMVIDPTGKTRGRGAYICKNEQGEPRQSCLDEAAKKRNFDRAFKKRITWKGVINAD